jgi:hypothetical protein
MASASKRCTAGRRNTAGWESGDAKKLKQLEDENQKLKHVMAELTLDNRALKDVVVKKLVEPVNRREAATYVAAQCVGPNPFALEL